MARSEVPWDLCLESGYLRWGFYLRIDQARAVPLVHRNGRGPFFFGQGIRTGQLWTWLAQMHRRWKKPSRIPIAGQSRFKGPAILEAQVLDLAAGFEQAVEPFDVPARHVMIEDPVRIREALDRIPDHVNLIFAARLWPWPPTEISASFA